ncbi:MAG: hypothetical protein AAF205_06145, partial [Pseudomonadota bacterium]
MNRRSILALAGVFVLSACAGSSNMVMQPNKAAYKANAVNLVYEGATVDVEEKDVAELQKFMENEFFGGDTPFVRGEDLTVRYGFMQFDEGSQAARYFLGVVGGGEAKMIVGAEFVDNQGNVVSKIQSEGRLNGGFFGGDAGSATKLAAREIADYAK